MLSPRRRPGHGRGQALRTFRPGMGSAPSRSRGTRRNSALEGFDEWGQHAIHRAIRGGSWYVPESSLSYLSHVDPNLRTLNDGTTPLILAASWGRIELLEPLLEHKADVNLCDNQKFTALHAAVWNGHLQAVDILLQHGADLEAKDDKGLTPMDWGDKRTDRPLLAGLMKAFVFFKMCAAHEADLAFPRPLLGIIAQYAFGVTGQSQVEAAFAKGAPEAVELWHDKSVTAPPAPSGPFPWEPVPRRWGTQRTYRSLSGQN